MQIGLSSGSLSFPIPLSGLSIFEIGILSILFIWTLVYLISSYIKYFRTLHNIKKDAKEHAGEIKKKTITPLAKTIIEEMCEIYKLKNDSSHAHLIPLRVEKVKKQIQKAYLMKSYLLNVFLLILIFTGCLRFYVMFDFLTRSAISCADKANTALMSLVLDKLLEEMIAPLAIVVIAILSLI